VLNNISINEKSLKAVINPDQFKQVVSKHMYILLEATLFLTREIEKKNRLTRPLIGTILQEASKMEELMDTYGAGNNKQWIQMRKAVAQTKIFSRIFYKLLHMEAAAPTYRLLPIEGEFTADIALVIKKTESIVYKNACKIQVLRKKYDLTHDKIDIPFYNEEFEPNGLLPSDCEQKHIEDPGIIVTYLASSFLTLSNSLNILDKCNRVKNKEYSDCIPSVISEEKLRMLENQCHNLQALYDTNISGSDLTSQDKNLPVLRGHISIIYHLLEIATECTHYYERHLAHHSLKENLVSNSELLNLVFRFLLPYASRFIRTLKEMCQLILKQYAEEGTVNVPIPNYRGFHVRPSTLVSKIVLHYGSDIHMLMDGTEYNASVPLELFRVNEEINASKRKKIAELIDKLPIIQELRFLRLTSDDLRYNLRQILFTLLENQKLIMYESTFSFDELAPIESENIVEFARRCIAHYMALGKVDIETDTTVTFKGDKRVLEDLKILAENGYGEDKFGNNIVLPASLSYLRRNLG